MKIETKFNSKDIVYFLTGNQELLDNYSSHIIKTGEVFVVKGQIGLLHITGNFGDEYEVEYDVYVKVENGIKQIRVHESMCAADPTELGHNVTNCYYRSGEQAFNNKY